MTEKMFVGVDGGATKCIVRVENEAGQLLGREASGPANIRISPAQAWDSIRTALHAILKPLNISLDRPQNFHVGMGLAGCEVMDAYRTFIQQNNIFSSLVVTSDAHTACLGAHNGGDGAIIIAGTGVVGFQVEQGETSKIGGWGFPHDDIGGGAWIGLQAMIIALQTLDGRLPQSPLAKAVSKHFNNDFNAMVSWANQANSTAFAELAPIVITHTQAGDAAATQILQQAAIAIEKVANALSAKQNTNEILPCTLVGGIAPFLEPYLSQTLRARLRKALATPDAGAVMLVRSSQNDYDH